MNWHCNLPNNLFSNLNSQHLPYCTSGVCRLKCAPWEYVTWVQSGWIYLDILRWVSENAVEMDNQMNTKAMQEISIETGMELTSDCWLTVWPLTVWAAFWANATTVPIKPMKLVKNQRNAETVPKKQKNKSWQGLGLWTASGLESLSGLFFLVFLVQFHSLALSLLVLLVLLVQF